MSKKKSREERRLKAGDSNQPAPLPPPPPPRPNLIHRQLGADPSIQDQRPAWLTLRDINDLIRAVEHFSTQHRLLPYLKQVKAQFLDADLQRRELEAAARSIQFWLEGESANVNGLIGKLKKGRKKGHRKLEAQIKCVSAAKMKKLLKDVGKEEVNGTTPPTTPLQ